MAGAVAVACAVAAAALEAVAALPSGGEAAAAVVDVAGVGVEDEAGTAGRVAVAGMGAVAAVADRLARREMASAGERAAAATPSSFAPDVRTGADTCEVYVRSQGRCWANLRVPRSGRVCEQHWPSTSQCGHTCVHRRRHTHQTLQHIVVCQEAAVFERLSARQLHTHREAQPSAMSASGLASLCQTVVSGV